MDFNISYSIFSFSHLMGLTISQWTLTISQWTLTISQWLALYKNTILVENAELSIYLTSNSA